MKTIARSRSSLMKSLMVAGGLLGLYYLRKNKTGGQRLLGRAKELMNKELQGSRTHKAETARNQQPTMDNIDLDRASPI